MVYEYTKNYICNYCGKKQTKDEQVHALVGDYLRWEDEPKYACKDCIRKGKVPGFSIGSDN